ncbi:ribonuclease P protein component [Leptolyngbya sp. PCC 6406]|uniref:ribonuclease P protein component n=1 Tax=Leptolyngbya sp. PCC 6406 TaxID=1173264 RepID=UPI0002AC1438|nr:ribonuclease P protein component [Leptolyngbya sp. PCC 6406]
MALPKSLRLHRSDAFSAVHRQGRRRRSDHLSVGVLPIRNSPEPHSSRFGITVSKKVSKRAVVRNRLKRQISAALQQLLPAIQNSYWVVVVVRPPAVECTYRQFLRELSQLLADLEVIDGDSRGRLL